MAFITILKRIFNKNLTCESCRYCDLLGTVEDDKTKQLFAPCCVNPPALISGRSDRPLALIASPACRYRRAK
jgi:hypothetical protein